MSEQIIWIVFFVILATLGLAVAAIPTVVARLLGAQIQTQNKKGLLFLWRCLGGLVLLVSVFELASLIVAGHVVR